MKKKIEQLTTKHSNYSILLFLSLSAMLLSGLSIDLYTPSLPWIAESMRVNTTWARYTVTAGLIGAAAGQLVFGLLADIYGRKLPLLLGVLLFCLASLIAAFSPNIYLLIAMRAIQGLTSASCSVIPKAVLTDRLKGKILHKALIALATSWSLGPIIGPFIGGYLQHHYGWQANFYFYAAFSLILSVLLLLYLEETSTDHIEPKLSTLLQHCADLFAHPIGIYAALVLGVGFGQLFVFGTIGPFLIQRSLHYDAITFGHMALIVGAGLFLGSLLNGYLLKHLHFIRIMQIGMASALLVSLLQILILLPLKMSLWTIILPTTLIIATTGGLVLPNCWAIVMRSFSHIAGIAASLIGSLLYLIPGLLSSLLSHFPFQNAVPYAWTQFSLALIVTLLLCYGLFPSVRKARLL